ncbi:unnamed protein product, partial [Vitis vinifera]|uniref:Uncharacterized protein n=1 Tax=Vitis vinifera TaxID=29760 RepID=D7UDW1_VITVI|eukprot:XP_003635079.1 PREDICTED: uncharacterized protein LOC100852443 [Vitis vinifera]
MVTKKATSCKDKAVLVTLYVEKPRKRINHHHHHHHHHLLYHTIKGEGFQQNYGADGRGYSRRALLLHYSQSLRESAQSAASASLNPKAISSKDQQPINKIAAGQSKPKHEKVPACLGDWKLSIASLVRSFTSVQAKKTSNKKKKKKKDNGSSRANIAAVMKNLKVQKKLGFISKLLKPSQKHT